MSESAIIMDAELSPGQRLKLAREKKGWDAETVAQKLNWNTQRVVDLENDHYDHRLAMIYMRGYLKAYSKLLGIDAQPLVNDFEASDWAKQRMAYEASQLTRKPTEEETHRPVWKKYIQRYGKKKYWISAASVLVVLIAWLGLRSPSESSQPIQGTPDFVVQPQELPEKRVTNSEEIVVTPIQNPNP
ncbi:MAG TPA: helix-turn-helix domain-containing protein [Coxiellaceae bacterium]|nr:helix-turn-helix domain-containing protein [Coxiellaceae bacterium]